MKDGKFFIAFISLIGLVKTGPSPSLNSTPKLKASGMVKISENKMLASRSNLLIGCNASSQQTSGSLHISRKFLNLDLIFLYSGRYLPA